MVFLWLGSVGQRALCNSLLFSPPSTSLKAEAAETEAKNFNFSRVNSVFGKKEAQTQPVHVGRAFQTPGNKAEAVKHSKTYLGSCSSLP